MFGLIKKSAIQQHIDRAVKNVSDTLGGMFDAEKKKICAQHADALHFMQAEKNAEIDEYCRQNAALRDIIARMERDKEDVKQGAAINFRLACNIDKEAKNVLDTTENMREELVKTISDAFKKYYETLAVHWQATAEIVNDTRAQQRKVIK